MKEMSIVPRALSIGNGGGRGGELLWNRSRLPQTVVARLCGGNQAAPLGLAVHNQMKIVPSTIFHVRDPNVGFGEGGIKVQSFDFRFCVGNHSADTRLAVSSESARLLVQSNKRSKRSTMNDEPDRRIVVPTTDDPGGHHDARFAREPQLQLCLLNILVEMGMKMNGPHACHIVGHGRHLLDRLPCPTIHHGPIRFGRNDVILFDELSNDFLVHISHFIDDVLNQGA